MAVRIRLTRCGKKHRAHYRIAVFDSRTRRDGPYLEQLGLYDPMQKEPGSKIKLDMDRYKHWVSNGALPTEALAHILHHTGTVKK